MAVGENIDLHFVFPALTGFL